MNVYIHSKWSWSSVVKGWYSRLAAQSTEFQPRQTFDYFHLTQTQGSYWCCYSSIDAGIHLLMLVSIYWCWYLKTKFIPVLSCDLEFNHTWNHAHHRSSVLTDMDDNKTPQLAIFMRVAINILIFFHITIKADEHSLAIFLFIPLVFPVVAISFSLRGA